MGTFGLAELLLFVGLPLIVVFLLGFFVGPRLLAFLVSWRFNRLEEDNMRSTSRIAFHWSVAGLFVAGLTVLGSSNCGGTGDSSLFSSDSSSSGAGGMSASSGSGAGGMSGSSSASGSSSSKGSSGSGGPMCHGDGDACMKDDECCSKHCPTGTCATPCKQGAVQCSANDECCSKNCFGGACAPGGNCKFDGLFCGSNLECCSLNCKMGFCAP